MPDDLLSQFLAPTEEDDDSRQLSTDQAAAQARHPLLEGVAQGLGRLGDYLRPNPGTGNSPGAKLSAALPSLLGVDALGSTLHRFAMGDSHHYDSDERNAATLDAIGALPVVTGGASVAEGGLRAALEGSIRADSKTALGMFTGQHAATSDLDALEQARLLTAAGKSPEEIHSITGWFKGADGKWRQEISDSTSQWNAGAYRRNLRQYDLQRTTMYRGAEQIQEEAKARRVPVDKIIAEFRAQGIDVSHEVEALAHNAKPEELQSMKNYHAGKYNAPLNAKLQDLLQHPELYEAYPHLKDIDVHFNDLGPNLQGSIDTTAGKMKLNSRNSYGVDGHETVLHEIQHAIQRHEGFDPGDSEGRILQSDYERARGHAQFEDTVQAAIDIRNGNSLFREVNPDAAELADDKTIPTEQLQEHLEFLQRNRPARISPEKAREMYNAAGGEVEARAVEKRRTKNRATIKGSYPMADYDTPTDQILLRNQR